MSDRALNRFGYVDGQFGQYLDGVKKSARGDEYTFRCEICGGHRGKNHSSRYCSQIKQAKYRAENNHGRSANEA